METCLFSSALALLLLNSLTLISSAPIFNLTTDENALLALKNTIIWDADGVSSSNWSTNTPICSWTGVSCSSKHRRVTALNLSGLALGGTVAPHLGNLTFLRSLDVSFNNFTGRIPSELSNLRRLVEIDFRSNHFAGEIPAWFGALSRLQYVNLNNNSFSGSIPNGIFNISSLIEIDLRYNDLSSEIPDDICNNTINPLLKRIYLAENQLSGEIPANIYKCRELEGVNLRKNQFTGNIPSGIGSLSKLSFLVLSSNRFTGNIPSSLFNLSSLKTMSLLTNSLTGTIPADILYNLPKIETLYFTNNHFTGGISKQFGNLTTLTVLNFAANYNLTGELPEELGNLARLLEFDASFNVLSGSIPSSIFNISSLTKLSLQQNLLSGSLPATMGLYLPNLQKLSLFFNRLTGEIPSSVANASMLTMIELNRNSLAGFIPDFGNLPQLQILRLWENNLTGAKSPGQELQFLSSLTNCRHLEIIEVTDNPLNGILPALIGNFSTSLLRFLAWDCSINGGIPSQIGNLSNLKYLSLSENQLTGFIPTAIGNLEQLQEVHLGGNRLQGSIPIELCRLSTLGVLNLSINLLTGPIHKCFGELRSLRELSFSSNKLNSTLPAKFWDLSDLVILDLSSNYLSGQLSPRIGTWKVSNLSLSSNMFSGDIPSSISDCQSLEFLSLSNNQFGGSIPEDMRKLRGLTTLDLSNNSLSGVIPKSLEELSDLGYFNVSYNRLEGEIPNGGRFSSFNASSFVHNSDLCGAERLQVPPCLKNHGRSRTISVIVKYIVPSFIAIIILVAVVVMLIRRSKRKNTSPPTDSSLEIITWRRISYIELVQGTSSFSEESLLGRGSFSSVYKATLSDGLNVAVKVFNLEVEGATKSFGTESEVLSSIRHRNLLPVVGCCTNIEFKALILRYMPNGSLEKWLHSENYHLDLAQRLRIAIDVALALEYLHHGHTFPVVHCDVKPSNVLLDEDMTAHVGDFGISKLFNQGEAVVRTTTLATIGYAAPEYGSEGKISTSGDVYSYGILLLEMFTGKKPTDDMFSGEMSLKDWVSEALRENPVSEVVAPGLLSIEDQDLSKQERCVSTIFDLAMRCSSFSVDERIEMKQVVVVLHKIKANITIEVVNNMRRSR